MITITQKYLPVPSLRRSGLKLSGVKYIVCHDTANDGATALNNVNYYINSANDSTIDPASAHAFVDAIGVIECVPLDEKAWHVRYNAGIAPNVAGSFANDCSIGVELCYSTKGLFDSKIAYNNYVEYIRGLCVKYGLDPRKCLVAHATLDPTRRTDPINAFGKIGKTWEMFINDVAGVDPLVTLQVPKSKVDKIMAFLLSIK